MEIQKATGIVLYSRAAGEADMWSRIFTREYGKRNFIFKGIKKSKTRSRAVTEPGTVAEILYYYHEDREYQVVNEFRIGAHTSGIRDDLSRIWRLYFLLETSDKTTGFNDPNPRLYNLLAAAVDTLAHAGSGIALPLFYALHLLRLHGILPDFERCRVCGRTDFETFTIDPSDLLPVCVSCAGEKGRNSLTLDGTARSFISLSMRRKFSALPHAQFSEEGLMQLLFYITLFIEHYFHVEIKSKSMIFGDR